MANSINMWSSLTILLWRRQGWDKVNGTKVSQGTLWGILALWMQLSLDLHGQCHLSSEPPEEQAVLWAEQHSSAVNRADPHQLHWSDLLSTFAKAVVGRAGFSVPRAHRFTAKTWGLLGIHPLERKVEHPGSYCRIVEVILPLMQTPISII